MRRIRIRARSRASTKMDGIGVRHLLDGGQQFKRNNVGRQMLQQHLWTQWRIQDGMCPLCNGKMDAGDCKFESNKFDRDTLNRVIHKKKCI